MRTQLSADNPFGWDRYGYAAEQLRRRRPEKHLDVGCYDGRWLHAVTGYAVQGCCGVDVNADAIRRGQRQYPELDLIHVADSRSLPFEEATFESVSLLDVIEHLDQDHQNALLRQVGISWAQRL